MFIHKYKINDETFYRVTGSAARPSKSMTINVDDWQGYSSGSSVTNAVKFLNSLTFSHEEKEPAKEEKGKKANLSSLVKRVAANAVTVIEAQ